jgi:hypothetical protein
MKSEYGADVFARGCPVCQELCCCVHKSVDCDRKNHCYRKCPASKNTDTVAKVNTLACDNHNHSDNGANQQNSFHLQSLYHDTSAKADGLSGFIGFPSGEQNGHAVSHHAEQDDHCLSKHGSLDFLAAAVSIIDNNERRNYHQDSQASTDICHEHEDQDGSRKRRRDSEVSTCSTANGDHYFGSEKSANLGTLQSTDSKQHPVYFLDQNLLSSQKDKLDSHTAHATLNGQECLHLPSIPIHQHESYEPKQNVLNHQIVSSYLRNQTGESQKKFLQPTSNQVDHSQDGLESAAKSQQHVFSSIKDETFPSNKNHEEVSYSIHGTNLKNTIREFQYPSSVPSVSNVVGNIPPL